MTEGDDRPSPWANGVWLNEPRRWAARDGALDVTTDRASDFWRETHYGFIRDSGHFYGLLAPAAFTAQLRVRGTYEHLYDQAGIMVRLDERRWTKAGLEFSDDRVVLSTVVTDDTSDWATGRYAFEPSDFWVRVTVAEGTLRTQVSADGRMWPIVRIAPIARAATYRVGPMCCTPERKGLTVRFTEWRLSAPLGKELHDLS